MNWYKMSNNKLKKPDNWQEMKDWFEKRTKNHIDLVRKYCKKIADYDDRFEDLIDRGLVHDDSKFEDQEYEPYVYITWKYKCEDNGKNFECPEDMEDRMNEATEHHVHNSKNRHHPESHSDQKETINREDRDKPTDEAIDATKMSNLDVAEMCADWVSVAQERGNSAKDWANKNVNIRWKFNEDQKELIYELIEVCEKDK